jgi:hypothetical protein
VRKVFIRCGCDKHKDFFKVVIIKKIL